MKQGAVTCFDITIKVDDIKTFFKNLFMDDNYMINVVVEKGENLGFFVVHFDKGQV